MTLQQLEPSGISGFMGIAICLLAMLKLMDVEAFAASFHKYDLLSQRWRAWGRLCPGIELLVGAVALAPAWAATPGHPWAW